MILAEEMNDARKKNPKTMNQKICDVSIFIQPFHTFSSQVHIIAKMHHKSNHVRDSYNNAEIMLNKRLRFLE